MATIIIWCHSMLSKQRHSCDFTPSLKTKKCKYCDMEAKSYLGRWHCFGEDSGRLMTTISMVPVLSTSTVSSPRSILGTQSEHFSFWSSLDLPGRTGKLVSFLWSSEQAADAVLQSTAGLNVITFLFPAALHTEEPLPSSPRQQAPGKPLVSHRRSSCPRWALAWYVGVTRAYSWYREMLLLTNDIFP